VLWIEGKGKARQIEIWGALFLEDLGGPGKKKKGTIFLEKKRAVCVGFRTQEGKLAGRVEWVQFPVEFDAAAAVVAADVVAAANDDDDSCRCVREQIETT
jgi:Tfp pilus assembly protein PilZ